MRLGKYQLIRQLAIGGMAEVYLARARGIKGFTKRVVLKRILPQYALSEDFVKMFLDEARLAATLDHPNVVQVYDIGQTVGNYYFTMEYVHGQDVRHILKTEHRAGHTVPWGCALAIARGIAAGLHYAHEQTDLDGNALGIVHRDVSLSNILVSYDGAVKLVDFGVAKCVARETQTRAGTLKGKIAYMSPEQCRGEPLDRRSDVFALGIILYELTTATRLFTGDNEFAILQKIATEDVEPPSKRRDDFPPELERIILKALRRDRDERYATARELQRDIEEFAREQRIDMSSLQLSDYMQELFAEEIASQPSDSGVSDASELARQAAELVGSAPSHASLLAGGVDTGMFDGPGESFADGSGESEAFEIDIEEAPPISGRRGHARAAALVAAAAALGALLATVFLNGHGDEIAPASPPTLSTEVQPAPAPTPTRVTISPSEPDAKAEQRDSTAARTATEPAKRRSSRSKPKATPRPKSKPKWNPDSPLPPPS